MSKSIRMKYPPDPMTSGQFFIQTIASFTENGFWWREELKSKQQRYAAHVRGKTYVSARWTPPELVLDRGDFVRLDSGKPCRCIDCIEGRRKVRAGWTPWGDK